MDSLFSPFPPVQSLLHPFFCGLPELNDQRAKVVEYRFFAGLTVEDAAVALGISKSAAEREWRIARAWLRSEFAA